MPEAATATALPAGREGTFESGDLSLKGASTGLPGFAEAAQATKDFDPSKGQEASQKKPEAKPIAKPTSKPEAKPVSQNGNGKTNGQTQQPQGKIDFKALKEKADRYDREFPTVTQERDEWRNKHEALEKTHRERENTFKEQEKLIEWARREQFANRLEESEPYQRDVARPWKQAIDECSAIAEKFFQRQEGESDEAASARAAEWSDALWDAISTPDRVDRTRALSRLLRDHPEAQELREVLQDTIASVQKAGRRAQELEEQSEGLRNQMVADRSAQQQRQQEQERVAEEKATKETWDLVQAQLPELFRSKDSEVLRQIEQAKSAKFVNDPMNRALAAAAVPLLIGLAGLYRKEIAAKDKTIADLSGAGVDGLDRPQEQTNETSQQQTAEQAFQAAMRAQYGRS